MSNFSFCKVDFFSKMEENFENFFCHSFVYGQRCFVPKNPRNWLLFWRYSHNSLKNLSLFLHFQHFWHTLMTKKCSEGLDLNFFMYWSTKKFFVKIGAPLVQKCSALPEYSHRLKYKYHLFPFRIGEHQKECRLCTGLAIWKQERKRGKFCYDKVCIKSNANHALHCTKNI